MAFCKNCGQEIKEGATFCNSCGAPVGEGAPVYAAAPVQPMVERVDFTADFDPEEINDCRVLAALCYIFSFVGVIIALLIRPNSRYIKFHVNQVLVLSIAYLLAVLVMIIPILGWIAGGIASVVLFVFMIIGFARALGRRAVQLPLIGKYKIFDWNK